MNSAQPNPRPAAWYRHPWPWLLMIPPLAAVIGGIAMVVLTARQPMPMVVDDYGKIGLVTERNHDRDRAARKSGIRAELEYRSDVRLLSLRLENTRPEWLEIELLHPTLAGRDATLRLFPQNGRYQVRVPETVQGRYHLQVLPPGGEWRLTADWQGESRLRLTP